MNFVKSRIGLCVTDMKNLFAVINKGFVRKRISGKELNLYRTADAVVQLPEVEVWRTADAQWIYRLANGAMYPCAMTNPDYNDITLYTESDSQLDTATRFLVRTAFECRFCHEGIVSLHAACVEKEGQAVAFTGISGLGKSTRARAWVENLGAEWISGDRPAVRLEKEGSTACGVPWDGKEQIFRNVERPL